MSVKIAFKAKKVLDKMKRLQKQMNKEMAKAINKTATESRKHVINKFAAESGAKKKNIRKLLPIVRADGRNPKKLFAIVKIFGKKLSMWALSKKHSAAGKGLDIRLQKRRVFIKGAFFAKMPSGHKGIFKRAGQRRLPIKEQKIRANPQIFKEDKLGSKEDSRNKRLLSKFFKENLKKSLAKFNRSV